MTVADEPYFILNRNRGVDVLHVQYPHEVCQTDDAEGLQRIDPMTAEALLVGRHAVPCQHCKPRPEG